MFPSSQRCWCWNVWKKGKACTTLWKKNTFYPPSCALFWCPFWRESKSKEGALRIQAALPLGEGNFGTHRIRVWMDPRVGLEALKKRKIPCLYWESNPGLSNSESKSLYKLQDPGRENFSDDFVCNFWVCGNSAWSFCFVKSLYSHKFETNLRRLDRALPLSE
jgi:hypothetical protein